MNTVQRAALRLVRAGMAPAKAALLVARTYSLSLSQTELLFLTISK